MPDGSLRFPLILPPDISQLFLKEMEDQDRKKLPLARYIITKYFKDKEAHRLTAENPQEQAVQSSEQEYNKWRREGRRASDHIPRRFEVGP